MTMSACEPIVLQANQVTKKYGASTALDGVDLQINQPGVHAILGSNGAGKTTFINCALGLTKPSRGSVRLWDRPAGHMGVRLRTGVMLQDADVPTHLTPREHISLFSSYYKNPLPLDDVLSICDLEPFANKHYGKLSGGQKRRVQFALAIVGQPDIIFLDEPTTGLDAEARRGLWAIVQRLGESGATIILTTHYLEEADSLAERIIVLHEGVLIADAPTQEIRDSVGGMLIRCVTKIPDETLNSLPTVRSFQRSGRFAEIMTNDATACLRELLHLDPDLHDLSVTKPSLEEAFLNITKNHV